MDLTDWLVPAARAIERWQEQFGPYDVHPSLGVAPEQMAEALETLQGRLADNYPFFHPRYAGQMLKPPHPAAVVGYLSAMLINPNNHALDGGPATAALEKEVVADLARMFGYCDEHLGHLTTSGTIANLEALYVARESHPQKGIAYSVDAHYTHARMAGVLRMPACAVATDDAGRMSVPALEHVLDTEQVGTVIATAGTTGLGAIDPVHEIVELCHRRGVRVHVDAAYGGFFSLIADDTADGVAAQPFSAIARADSVVIDPHKHGLQPYGCGAVLFRDPAVGRFYSHDSPYTYFTSEELHLGEISLECSRSGAAAAALWLTLQVLPLTVEGLGSVLRAARHAALDWHERLQRSAELVPYQWPQLDIVSALPRTHSLREIDRISAAVMTRGMQLPPDDAVFLATYAVSAQELRRRGHPVVPDLDDPAGRVRILRSVMMKPESVDWVAPLVDRVERLAREVR